MGRQQIASFLLIVCMCSTTSLGFNSTCKEAERNALLKFKHSITTDPSNHLGSWVGEDCCSWKGVGCDSITRHVVKLDLRGHWIYGESPYDYLEAREVSPALLELKYLTYLDLSGNDFNGSRIPEFLGSFSQLQYLYLSNAFFGGKVPHHLGNLTKLLVLDLSILQSLWFNRLGVDSLEWALKLKNLQYLDLGGSDLSHALDSLYIIHKLPSLSVLNLVDCGLGNSHLVTIKNSNVSSTSLQQLRLAANLFSGPFPHFIQNLSSITRLDLSYNHLSSSIPSWLGNKIDLRYLLLGSNYFNGSFPQGIQNLTSLTGLDLSDNQINSPIPSWLANKRYLKFAVLNDNHFSRVDGGIMNTIGRLCTLRVLDLSHNQLQENILELDVHFLRCSRYDLQYIDLKNNSLSGQLPLIERMSSLQWLDMSHNKFEFIPASFGHLSSLELVDLSYNHLSVVHQENLANLSVLRDLDLSSNSLILDLSLDWLPPFQLESLRILPCKLNSPFPKWLLSQDRILELDLSDTGIFGPLPDNIGNAMPSLRVLQLANNSINGSIPRSLCKLVNLSFLNLQKNRLSGMIPDCWDHSRIIDMALSSNRLSGPIPNSLTKVGTLQTLSLNSNSFEGELSLSFSNCLQLMVLDVGKNKLHGEIPAWNGANFPALQILILRENRFKGIIPPQLCSVHTLQIIDLASNNLVGTIPQCVGHFEGMRSLQPSIFWTASPPSPPNIAAGPMEALPPAMYSDEWTAVEVIKGKGLEYTKILHLLVNMDLSCNNLVGVIPAEITNLTLLLGLNLSHNHLTGAIPQEMGKMRSLESLDLSFNDISGSIPKSISSLNSLVKMNVSFNNLEGEIPTGNQLQTLEDPPSIYMGNPRLCGDPLPRKCFDDNIGQPPTSTVIEDEEEENKHEKMWFYLVIMLGFAIGFWGVIGILVVKRRWRHAFFQLAEDLAEWVYVRVAVGIARAKGGR